MVSLVVHVVTAGPSVVNGQFGGTCSDRWAFSG